MENIAFFGKVANSQGLLTIRAFFSRGRRPSHAPRISPPYEIDVRGEVCGGMRMLAIIYFKTNSAQYICCTLNRIGKPCRLRCK